MDMEIVSYLDASLEEEDKPGPGTSGEVSIQGSKDTWAREWRVQA